MLPPSAAVNFNPRSPHGERPGQRETGCTADDFNPRSPHGERRFSPFSIRSTMSFQPTLPARGATSPRGGRTRRRKGISTHAPRTGSDTKKEEENHDSSNFNPRSPHGERQINPATMRGSQGISTHAPRTGSDDRRFAFFDAAIQISTHAPRTGSDRRGLRVQLAPIKFQPTLPARGATP